MGISLNELDGLVLTCTPQQLAKAPGGVCPVTSGQQVRGCSRAPRCARQRAVRGKARAPTAHRWAPLHAAPSAEERPCTADSSSFAHLARSTLGVFAHPACLNPAAQTIDLLGLDYITIWGAALALIGFILVARAASYLGVRYMKW